MDPLSAKTRRNYLILFILLAIIVIPLAILYASGYRIKDGFSLVSTGGLFVAAPLSDVTVSINGKPVGTTGLFTRDFFEDNLAPGAYAVSATREGYYPWYKTLIVEKSLVTDAQAFLVPQTLDVLELVRGTATSTASTTRAIPRAEYDSYLASFAPATTSATSTKSATKVATSSLALASLIPLPDDVQGGLELYLKEGNILLTWSRATSTIPSQLCTAPSSCMRDFYIEKGKETTVSAHFYAGGVLYATKEGGVHLSEVDVRPTPLLIPIYPRRGADFRIIDGNLIIKDGPKLYQVLGL